MDSSVGKQEKDLVDGSPLELSDVLFELLKQGSKVGWPTQSNWFKCLPVSCDNILDTHNFRGTLISINWEAVMNVVYAHVAWNSTKSEHRETCITIVWLKHSTDRVNRFFVLIIWTQIV